MILQFIIFLIRLDLDLGYVISVVIGYTDDVIVTVG